MRKCKWSGDKDDVYCSNCNGVTMEVDGKEISCEECNGYEEGFVPDHIDRNRKNNRADNLRWVSKSMNAKNAEAWANRKIDNYNEPVIFTNKSGEKK